MPDPMNFTRANVDALAAKLDALELTDDERALLNTVFDAATTDDVAGYGVIMEERPNPMYQPPSARFLGAFQPGSKLAQVGIIIIC